MRARLLELSGTTESDVTRWAALAERASEPNAALDPRFLLPDRSGGSLLIAEESGVWYGLVRLFPTDVSSTLGVPAYGTFEPSVLGPPFPLLDRDHAVEALTVIARGVRRHLCGNYLSLRGYPAAGPLADAVSELRRRLLLDASVLVTHIAPWVNVRPGDSPPGELIFPAQTDPEYRSSSTRKELRRNARRLAEAGGGALTVHDASNDPAAIDRFVKMQASGWKGDRESGGYAVALDPERERAFREKVEMFRATGDLIVLELWAGPTHVYSHVYVVSAGVAMGILDAYQHEFAPFSTGKLGRTAVSAHLGLLPRLVAVNPGYYYYNDVEALKAFPDRREFFDVVIGVGLVPSLMTRLLPRVGMSKRARNVFIVLSRVDRYSLRVVGAVKRRLKPKGQNTTPGRMP